MTEDTELWEEENLNPDSLVTLLTGTVDLLKKADIAGTGHADRIHRQLKEVNKRIWSLVRSIEAGQLEEWFELGDIIDAIVHARLEDGSALDHVDVWIELLKAGALTVRSKPLLEAAAAAGVDPEDHRRSVTAE